MRRLAHLCLGLALAAPALAHAQSPQSPGPYPPAAPYGAAPAAEHGAGHGHGKDRGHGHGKDRGHGHATQRLYAGHLCGKCAEKLPKRVPAEGPGLPPMAHPGAGAPAPAGGCQSCQAAPAAPGYGAPTYPAPQGYGPGAGAAPGMAFVGGEPAGYAQIGGLPSTDPAPIGVMRTDYAPAAPTGTGTNAVIDPLHGNPASRAPWAGPAGPGYGPAMMGAAPAMGTGDTTFGGSTRSRQRKVLSNMLGLPSFRPRGARGEERRRESHAMISYGSGAGVPADLPASMVYGPR